MNKQLRRQYRQFWSPTDRQPAHRQPIHPMDQIYKLKKENQMLKSQLHSLINPYQHQRHLTADNPSFYGSPCASEYQYSRKTTMKSRDDHIHPRIFQRIENSMEQSPNRLSIPHNYQFIQQIQTSACPSIFLVDPRVKPMVILKDKDGKCYRDRQKQRQIYTYRSNATSICKTNPIQARISSPSHYTKISHHNKYYQMHNLQTGHKRTNRNPKQVQSPSFVRNRHNGHQKENVKQISKERNVRKQLFRNSPRELIQQQGKKSKPQQVKYQLQILQQKGDSCLTIERQLRLIMLAQR